MATSRQKAKMPSYNSYQSQNIVSANNSFRREIERPTTMTLNKSKYKQTTYNENFPWLNENSYRKLEAMVDEKWLTGVNKENAMNYLYRQNVKYLVNDQILDDRAKEINEQAYQAAELNNPQAYAQLRMTEFSQALKKKYNLDAKANDLDVFNTFVENLWEDGVNLAGQYLAGENMKLWQDAWLTEYWDIDINQWGIKWRIADEWSNTEEWSILPNAWELLNPIWYLTETLDTLWQKWADYITIWKREREDLINKISELSDEDLQQYRKWYENSNYDGSFEDYIIDTNKTRWQDMVGADEELKWISEPNVFKFFGNMPASTLRLVTSTLKWVTNPVDVWVALWKLLWSSEWRDTLKNRYLTAEWWANAMNYDSVGTAEELLSVANSFWNLVKWTWRLTNIKWLENAGSFISENVGSPLDVAVEKWLYWGDITYWTNKNNMKTTNVKWLYWVMDDLAWDNAILKGVNRYAQDTSSLSKLIDNTKSDINAIENSSFGQAIKNAKDEFINKVVGIDENDREFIRNNKELTNDILNWKKNVETILNDVKDKVSEKRVSNSDLWKEYDVLRKDKSKVVDTKNITRDMKKSLDKNWITIDKDWNLKFKNINKFNDKQKAALIDAWEELKFIEKKKNINAWNVLDMRQKFDDKLNWDGKAMDLNWNLSAVDKATEWLIREMRWVIDNRAKKSVAWLEKLDTKYGNAMEEMAQIRKDWLNPDGTFKDSARSKLRNLTKAWNEEKLARLEKLMPWISNDLKALDVWLTIERAAKQGVWQYSKWVLAWSLPAWIANPIAWLAGLWLWILSTPKNYVKLIEVYPDIANKLEAWTNLSAFDVNRLQQLAVRLEDTGNSF